VAGVDEVGRGCWAGPVTAAAVILTPSVRLPGVHDSKLLTSSQRERVVTHIRRRAVAVGVGWASSAEIDQYGLSWAVATSGQRALANLGQGYDAVILDGNHNYLQAVCTARAIIRADQLSLSVAAASIIAKVARDRYMRRLDRCYPGYGFARHKGYGTAGHVSALDQGLSPQHRRLFKPIQVIQERQGVN